MTSSDYNEAGLIRRAMADDEVAMAALFAPQQDRIFSYIYRWVGHWQTAEDLAQDVLVKAMHALPRYRHRGHFRAWLFTIARRELFMHLRRDRVRRLYRKFVRENPEEQRRIAPEIACPSRLLEREEECARLRDCIQRLPSNERDVVLLRIYSELPFREIAEMLGCPLNSALTRMHKAQKRLKTMMEQDNGDTSHE